MCTCAYLYMYMFVTGKLDRYKDKLDTGKLDTGKLDPEELDVCMYDEAHVHVPTYTC